MSRPGHPDPALRGVRGILARLRYRLSTQAVVDYVRGETPADLRRLAAAVEEERGATALALPTAAESVRGLLARLERLSEVRERAVERSAELELVEAEQVRAQLAVLAMHFDLLHGQGLSGVESVPASPAEAVAPVGSGYDHQGRARHLHDQMHGRLQGQRWLRLHGWHERDQEWLRDALLRQRIEEVALTEQGDLWLRRAAPEPTGSVEREVPRPATSIERWTPGALPTRVVVVMLDRCIGALDERIAALAEATRLRERDVQHRAARLARR